MSVHFSSTSWWNELKGEIDRIIPREPYVSGNAIASSIEDTTQKISLAIIKENEANLTAFRAKAHLDGVYTQVGSIIIEFFGTMENGNYEGENTKFSKNSILMRYGLEEAAFKANKIFVEDLLSSHRQKLHGVGTALMQAAIEYSYSKGCEGRILLSASPSSHVFYYKLGMRTLDPAQDALIEKEWNDPTQPREMRYMYMPEAARLMWKERIKRNPIFSETIQLLGEHS